MKKSLLFIGVLACALTINAQETTVSNPVPGSAQTTTNPPGANVPILGSISPVLGTLAGDAKHFFEINADLFTNNMVGVEVFGLYAPEGKTATHIVTLKSGQKTSVTSSSPTMGGGFDIQLPLSNFQSTNSDASALLSQSYVGFGIFYDGQNLNDVTASFGIGNNFNIPILGLVHGFVEAGPGKNLGSGAVIGTSFVGAKYRVPLEKFWPSFGQNGIIVTVGGAYGTITDIHGPVYSAGGSVIIPLSNLGDWFKKAL